MPTKVLVSIASLVVIAAGGYFFWGEYQKGNVEACQNKLVPWAESYVSSANTVEDEAFLLRCIEQGHITDAYLVQFGMTIERLKRNFNAGERAAPPVREAPVETLIPNEPAIGY